MIPLLWFLWDPEFQDSPLSLSAGGGLLQGGLQGPGELRDSLAAGQDPKRLEETGSDENLLFRCCGPREWGELGLGALPVLPSHLRVLLTPLELS